MNIQPEFHETGYTKYTSRVEKQINWLQEIRCDITASARYLAMEDAFVKVQEEGVGASKTRIFKMPGMSKVLLSNFMEARNNGLIWNKSTMDDKGRCMLQDREGRDLICGDGLVAQISRYCGKTSYTKMSVNILTRVLQDLIDKCENTSGNELTLVCNSILMNQLQQTCYQFLQANTNKDGQWLYSRYEGDKIKVGATFGAFTYLGNTISFRIDRALTNEYSKGGYGILLDLTTDTATGKAPVSGVTLKGKQMVQNDLNGVGVKPGAVATPVAGQRMMVSGYAGLMVANPYRTHILIENV